MKIDKTKFSVKYTRANKNGGQHVNKVETCVVITHLPTGLKEKCEETRYKNKNFKLAYDRLVKRLDDIEKNKKHDQLNQKRNEAIENAGRIRTYNYERNTVKDHRTGKTADLKKVLNGNLDLLH